MVLCASISGMSPESETSAVDAVFPEEEVVVRATLMTAAIIFLNACFFSVILIGGGLAVALHRRHHALIWVCVVCGALAGTATAARLQARFNASGIGARNTLRSLTVRWPDVASIRLIPAVWYCSDPGWAATMQEVETVDGRRFPLRCCTHLSRGKAEHLCAFLNQKAAEFHFDVPHSLTQLWRVNEVPT
jgi:hypothetical protein